MPVAWDDILMAFEFVSHDGFGNQAFVSRETGAVFTLEEHSVDGGLGGAVAELLAEAGEGPITFRRFGLPFFSVVPEVGSNRRQE